MFTAATVYLVKNGFNLPVIALLIAFGADAGTIIGVAYWAASGLAGKAL